jgi:hypothetical protein
MPGYGMLLRGIDYQPAKRLPHACATRCPPSHRPQETQVGSDTGKTTTDYPCRDTAGPEDRPPLLGARRPAQLPLLGASRTSMLVSQV